MSRQACFVSAIAILANAAAALGGVTDKLTVSLDGSPLQGTTVGTIPALSANGRFMVYSGSYKNMAPGDTTSAIDILVKDFATGAIEIVSRNSSGQQANGDCFRGSISSDGRYVAFSSNATNLATPPSTTFDVYVRDRQLGTTTRVSHSLAGGGANQSCSNPRISRNGRYVGFTSTATNLVASDVFTANDAFIADRISSVVTRVSTDSTGMTPNQGQTSFTSPVIASNDGGYAAFASSQPLIGWQPLNGVVQVLRKNLSTGVVEAVSVDSSGQLLSANSELLDMNGDGNLVYFSSVSDHVVAGDTNAIADAFLRNLSTGTVSIESVGDDGLPGSPASAAFSSIEGGRISSDGRFATFDSIAILHSLPTGIPQVTSERQVFLRDRVLAHTYRISLSSSGGEPNGGSALSAVSEDGSTVSFLSVATDLAVGDTNPYFLLAAYARWREGFKSLEMGKTGSFGIPQLVGSGDLTPGSTGQLDISSAAPNASALLVLSLSQGNVPFFAGTFQAVPPFTVAALVTDASGGITLPFALPPGALPVKRAFLQAAIIDPGAVAGVSATNLVSAVFP